MIRKRKAQEKIEKAIEERLAQRAIEEENAAEGGKMDDGDGENGDGGDGGNEENRDGRGRHRPP